MKLENWSIGTASISPFHSPESLKLVLRGIIYGNPKFSDGTMITTSVITGVVDGNIITKSGSVYELGEVDPDYENYYPNAKTRLINHLLIDY